MTAFEDREKRAAISALVHRLQNRAGADDEPFAAEFITALWGRGWRPVEALKPHDWRQHGEQGTGEGRQEFREALAALKAQAGGQMVQGEVIPDRPALEAGRDP